MIQLTKQSSDSEIKAYFIQVLNLSRSKEEFPVNLDEVWPLVYSRRDKAVRALRSGEIFMEGIDYQVLPPNGEKSDTFSHFWEKVQDGDKNEKPRGGLNVMGRHRTPICSVSHASSSLSPAGFVRYSRFTARYSIRWQEAASVSATRYFSRYL